MTLKYYQEERTEFVEYNTLMVIGQKEAIKIINKLCRHYKMPEVVVTFDKRVGGGRYYAKNVVKIVKFRHSDGRVGKLLKTFDRISLHKSMFSIGTVVHEFAHHMQWYTGKVNVKWHTKKHRSIMKRVLKYCVKKNYWGWVK